MNIVQFWQDQVKIWNEEQKCGFCWAFGGGLTEAGINAYRIREGEECCVHLFVTVPTLLPHNENNENGLVVNPKCDYGFVLWALKPSRLDINNHNEIPSHDENEGAWNSIHYPLIECLGCDEMQYVCENLGYAVEISRWMMEAVFKQFDNNYDGWRIEGTFTKNRY